MLYFSTNEGETSVAALLLCFVKLAQKAVMDLVYVLNQLPAH